MSIDVEEIDWSLCTWEGSKRAQIRGFLRLTVRERLEAVEAMGRLAEALQRARAGMVAGKPTTTSGLIPPQ
jgi:hypothetical protein